MYIGVPRTSHRRSDSEPPRLVRQTSRRKRTTSVTDHGPWKSVQECCRDERSLISDSTDRDRLVVGSESVHFPREGRVVFVFNCRKSSRPSPVSCGPGYFGPRNSDTPKLCTPGDLHVRLREETRQGQVLTSPPGGPTGSAKNNVRSLCSLPLFAFPSQQGSEPESPRKI